MTRRLITLFAAVVLAHPASATAQKTMKLPAGTTVVLAPTSEADGPGQAFVLDGVRFLITRADLDYYNALQDKYDTGVTALEDCHKQVIRLSPVAGDKPTRWWDTGLGPTIVVGGAVVALSVTFVIGYALGGG